MEIHKVTLFKDKVYEDFGFSVSDGLYERGIFVNRIRRGGPADASGMLRPLDRILQAGKTRLSGWPQPGQTDLCTRTNTPHNLVGTS